MKPEVLKPFVSALRFVPSRVYWIKNGSKSSLKGKYFRSVSAANCEFYAISAQILETIGRHKKNFFTRQNLGEKIKRLTNNKISSQRTKSLKNLDGLNCRNIEEGQQLLKDAQRCKWYSCQAYHNAAPQSRCTAKPKSVVVEKMGFVVWKDCSIVKFY